MKKKLVFIVIMTLILSCAFPGSIFAARPAVIRYELTRSADGIHIIEKVEDSNGIHIIEKVEDSNGIHIVNKNVKDLNRVHIITKGSKAKATKKNVDKAKKHQCVKKPKTKKAKAKMPEYKMVAGRRTVKNFLTTSLAPVGKVLWVTGGGWNREETAPDEAARSIGISKEWVDFYNSRDVNYSLDETEPIDDDNINHAKGLDAVGYLGWAIYNTLYCQSLKYPGFVYVPDELVKSLNKYCTFEGTETLSGKDPIEIAKTLKPGDFIIMPGRHMYVYLGGCKDGSFVIAHAAWNTSRTGANGGGVQISAVSNGANPDCEAYKLAKEYMEKYYPDWNGRYETLVKDTNTYLNFYDYAVGPEANGIFHWKKGVLADPEKYCKKSAKEILKDLYK